MALLLPRQKFFVLKRFTAKQSGFGPFHDIVTNLDSVIMAAGKQVNKDNNAMPPGPNEKPDQQETARSINLKRAGFVVFMLALTAVFVYFGTRQTQKLAENDRLSAIINQRINKAPIGLPPVGEWVGFDPEIYNFRPLTVSGNFAAGGTVLVFTRLSNARGSFSGPGYWVMAPLYLDSGGIVFINRGFVPEQSAARFKQGGIETQGPVTIVGLGRVSEPLNSFTPGTDFSNRMEWVRNIKRLTQFITDAKTPVAPIYIDAKAGETGALPQGGETRVNFAAPYRQYALIWFFMAAIPPLILLVWLISNRNKTPRAQTEV